MASDLLGFIGFNAGGITNFIKIIIWGTIVITFFTIIAVVIRNKIKYQYFGEIIKRRQSQIETGLPQAVVVSGKAGYFVKRNGKTVFRIKFGRMPWQQIELSKLPNPEYMIGNKVYYLQLNKDNFVQCKVSIDWKGGYNLEPVEDDLKYGAQLDLEEKSAILRTKSTFEKMAPVITIGFILVAGIIVFYFLGKAC